MTPVTPAVRREDFWGDLANTLLLRPVYRETKQEHERRAMTNQVIPAEAVEAAHKAWREQSALEGSIFEYNLRAALEAAVSYIHNKEDS